MRKIRSPHRPSRHDGTAPVVAVFATADGGFAEALEGVKRGGRSSAKPACARGNAPETPRRQARPSRFVLVSVTTSLIIQQEKIFA
jgi:hypothetical protein